MSKHAAQLRGTVIKLGVFVAVMALVLTGLVLVFSEYRSGASERFHATFSDVSGLENGDKVRIAGVDIGRVQRIEIADGNLASVRFSVDDDQAVLASTVAAVRYENLTGDRYLELQRGEGEQTPLEPGSTIPLDRTEPALDLDALLGGFRPLFRALNPEQVNRLSESIIEVFQGEAGNVQALLSATSSLTTSLANRDELIGEVITNLNQTLDTVNENRDGVDSIVVNLQEIISGLSANAGPIGESVERVNDASASMTELLADARPPLRESLSGVDDVAGLVADDEEYVESVINRLPDDFERMARLGAYGGFFNFYLCGVIVRLPAGPEPGNDLFLEQFEQYTGRCEM